MEFVSVEGDCALPALNVLTDLRPRDTSLSSISRA